jgi:hypothetical protein
MSMLKERNKQEVTRAALNPYEERAIIQWVGSGEFTTYYHDRITEQLDALDLDNLTTPQLRHLSIIIRMVKDRTAVQACKDLMQRFEIGE